MTKTLILPGDGEFLDLTDAFGDLVPQSYARGTNALGDVITQTVDGRPLNDIWAEIQQTLEFFNRSRQAIVDLLTFPVNEPIEDVPQGIAEDFEEASEFGEPVGIRGASYFTLGYDFKWYDIAVRYTWKYLAEATAAQVENLHQSVMESDNRLIFKKVLSAVFNNAARTTDIRGNNIPVYPFYSNDGTVPPTYKNTTFLSTHNHYLASGAATVDAGDLDAIEDHITHHGYGADNGGNLVLLVNKQEGAVIRTFRVGVAGAAYDFIPSTSQPAFLLPGMGIQGSQPPGTYRGLTVIGSYGNWTIIQDDYVPAGYMLGFATGGEMSASNPVGFRQHANSGLRGLRLLAGAQHDYPLVDSFYQRGFGTGVRHRGAGVVMKITAGAYDVPAAFA